MKDKNNTSHEEFGQMMRVLMEDLSQCWDKLHEATTSEDQDFWKRVFTRAVFAQIEGFTEFFRSQALTAELNKLFGSIATGLEIAPGKLSVLSGETYFINDMGEIRFQSLRTPFLPNLLFCFNSFAEAHGVTHRVKKGDQWSRIQSAVQLRDNLMHPKNLKSLDITEKEIEDVVFTLKWFYRELHLIIKLSGKGEQFQEFPDEFFKLNLKKVK
jgi:hypothetical protein